MYDPTSAEYKFKAFISYRHVPRDMAAAKALHTLIERYTIPVGRKETAFTPRKKWKVFRDEEELRVTSDLPQSIHDALDASEFLIVICSPESMDSLWVHREIAYFLRHHDQEHILTVVTAGDPGQMIPDLLFRVSAEGYDTSRMKEPLYMDIRAGNSRNMKRLLKAHFLKLAATLHGCAYDDLVMRDQRHRKRRMLLWSIGISCIAAVIIGILLWSNRKIDEKNRELKKQYNEILMRESELLAQDALDALAEGDWVSAISYALSALSSTDNNRPYNATAEQVLLSAIRPLDYPERPQILQNTVLSQTTRIDAYCINSDGSRLVTVDWYGFLTCFDTVAGQILWTIKIDPISESYTNSLVNYAPENTILFLYDSGVCSVSWENGEILWNNDYGEEDVCIIASDQGNSLAVLSSSYYYIVDGVKWRSSYDWIDFLSPVNGCVNTSTCLNVGFNDNMHLEFSGDGNRFAYTYRNYDTVENEICFIINCQTGSYDSIVFPDRGNEQTDVSIQFTPDDNGLLVLHYTEGEVDYNWLDLYDFSTQSFIWSTSIQGTDDNEYVSQLNDVPLVSFFPEYILISEDTELHLLDIHSGKYLCSANTEYVVEDIVVLSDTTFGFVMNNGGYALGYLSDTLISRSDYDAYSVSYDLNTDGSCSLWNGGFFFDDFGSDGYTVGSEKDGLGYAVVLSLDDMKLTIIRPYRTTNDYGQVYGDNFDFLCRTEIIPYGEDLIVGLFAIYHEIEEQFYCCVVDPDTLEVKQKIDVSDNTHVHFLANGSGYLRWDGNLELTHVDPISGKETPVLTPDMKFCFSYEGSDIMLSPMMEESVRLAATNDYWTVALTDAGVISWTNGAQMTTVPYPEGINLSDMYCPYNGYQAEIFESGHLLVSFEKNMAGKQETDCYLYDRNADAWYNCFNDHEVGYALFHPWYAEMDEDETIIIRNYTSEQIVTEVPCIFPAHTIDQISFVLDDRYLLITTDENLLKLYDLTTSEEVFSYQGYYYSAYTDYICKADSQNQRVYLYTDENGYYDEGLCIDMRSWTLLTQIDEMACFDPGSGILVRSPFIPESGYHFMMGRLPSTEELIAYGREILTQQNVS